MLSISDLPHAREIEPNGAGCGRRHPQILSGPFSVARHLPAAGRARFTAPSRCASRPRPAPMPARMAPAGRPGPHPRPPSPVEPPLEPGRNLVASPVRANDGGTLVLAEGRWWQLEPWMPGCADFESRPSDSRLAAAATSLARLHAAMASFEATGAEKLGFYSHPQAIAPAVAERIERLRGLVGRPRRRLVAEDRTESGDVHGLSHGRTIDRGRVLPVRPDDRGRAAAARQLRRARAALSRATRGTATSPSWATRLPASSIRLRPH